MNPYIGHNLVIKQDLLSTVDYSKEIGGNFFQIFLSSPHKYNAPRKNKKELSALGKKLKKNNMKIVIHANFMLNFCNPPKSFKHKSAIILLMKDLEESVIIGEQCLGVVIHMGKKLKLSENEAVRNYIRGVKLVLKHSPKESIIIFETGAGQGSEICTELVKMSKLYHCFTDDEKKRIKICIDTCHVFSAGYDIGNVEFIDEFCQSIEKLFGWKNIACIHLNDSKCPLNCRKDRHADLTKGHINPTGLSKFVKYCVSKNIPIVLETPCNKDTSKKDNIDILKKWIEAN